MLRYPAVMARPISAERFFALTDAAASLVSILDLEQLLARIVETAKETTGAKYVALGVIGEHKTLTEFVHRGIDVEVVRRIGHLPEGRGVLGTLIRERRSIRLNDLSSHPDSVGFPEHHPPMKSFLGVPVGSSRDAFGNLYLTEKEGGFTQEDQQLIEALAAIAAAAVETARLRSRLESLAVNEDRQRIGRDLHDSIIQDLFGTGLELQGISGRVNDDTTRGRIDSAVDRIDRTIEDLRGIVSNLSRSVESGSVEETLRGQLQRLAQPYDVAVALTVLPPGLKANAGLSDALIPIVIEATSNALRHSGTEFVDIRVEIVAGRALVSVADQGSGFDGDTVVKGLGLKNLEERVAELGGESSVRSVLGVGTVVEVSIPAGVDHQDEAGPR